MTSKNLSASISQPIHRNLRIALVHSSCFEGLKSNSPDRVSSMRVLLPDSNQFRSRIFLARFAGPWFSVFAGRFALPVVLRLPWRAGRGLRLANRRLHHGLDLFLPLRPKPCRPLPSAPRMSGKPDSSCWAKNVRNAGWLSQWDKEDGNLRGSREERPQSHFTKVERSANARRGRGARRRPTRRRLKIALTIAVLVHTDPARFLPRVPRSARATFGRFNSPCGSCRGAAAAADRLCAHAPRNRANLPSACARKNEIRFRTDRRSASGTCGR